jgi:hypothetical protein
VETPVGKADHSFARFLLAYPDASTAEHALIGVIGEQRAAGVYWQFGQDFPEPFCLELHPKMLGYLLKFTGTIFQAMGAIHRVTGQEQFQSSVGKPQCVFTSGANHHPLCYGNSTGCNWVIFTFYLHKAETARSRRLTFFSNSAKVGDVDAVVQSCPEDLFPRGSSYFLAVNRQRDFFDFGQYSLPLFSP